MKERGKKFHPNCCNDNQSPLPRAAWCQPVSKQWPPWQKNTPSFIAKPHVTWNGIARWPVQISFPGCVASSCPPLASSLRGRLSNGESLTLYRHCSAIARTVVCDQHCFSPKSGMQHHKGCYQETAARLSTFSYLNKLELYLLVFPDGTWALSLLHCFSFSFKKLFFSKTYW